MGLLKSLFQKKKSSCCDVKIEEVKEEAKSESEDKNEQKGNTCCGK